MLSLIWTAFVLAGQVGWRSRAFGVDDPPEIVTANGIIKAIALVRGRAAGTWSLRGGRVELSLWEKQSPAALRALTREQAAVQAYLA